MAFLTEKHIQYRLNTLQKPSFFPPILARKSKHVSSADKAKAFEDVDLELLERFAQKLDQLGVSNSARAAQLDFISSSDHGLKGPRRKFIHMISRMIPDAFQLPRLGSRGALGDQHANLH